MIIIIQLFRGVVERLPSRHAQRAVLPGHLVRVEAFQHRLSFFLVYRLGLTGRGFAVQAASRMAYI